MFNTTRVVCILNITLSERAGGGTALVQWLARHAMQSELEAHVQQRWFEDGRKRMQSCLQS